MAKRGPTAILRRGGEMLSKIYNDGSNQRAEPPLHLSCPPEVKPDSLPYPYPIRPSITEHSEQLLQALHRAIYPLLVCVSIMGETNVRQYRPNE